MRTLRHDQAADPATAREARSRHEHFGAAATKVRENVTKEAGILLIISGFCFWNSAKPGMFMKMGDLLGTSGPIFSQHIRSRVHFRAPQE